MNTFNWYLFQSTAWEAKLHKYSCSISDHFTKNFSPTSSKACRLFKKKSIFRTERLTVFLVVVLGNNKVELVHLQRIYIVLLTFLYSPPLLQCSRSNWSSRNSAKFIKTSFLKSSDHFPYELPINS